MRRPLLFLLPCCLLSSPAWADGLAPLPPPPSLKDGACPCDPKPVDLPPPTRVVRRAAKPKPPLSPVKIVVGPPGPKGDQGDPGPAGPQGEKGDQGDPGETKVVYVDQRANVYPILGLGYRTTRLTSIGRPTATSYGPELQLRLALGKSWEFTVGGSYLPGGDNATMVHASLDWYPLVRHWLGFTLGAHGQWYAIHGNLARGQIIGAAPGILARTPLFWNLVEFRCEAAALIGTNGFVGDRSGAAPALGFTGACDAGLRF